MSDSARSPKILKSTDVGGGFPILNKTNKQISERLKDMLKSKLSAVAWAIIVGNSNFQLLINEIETLESDFKKYKEQMVIDDKLYNKWKANYTTKLINMQEIIYNYKHQFDDIPPEHRIQDFGKSESVFD